MKQQPNFKHQLLQRTPQHSKQPAWPRRFSESRGQVPARPSLWVRVDIQCISRDRNAHIWEEGLRTRRALQVIEGEGWRGRL